MGILGKLAFWKRDLPALPKDIDLGTDMGMPGEDHLGMPGLGKKPDNMGMPGLGNKPEGMPGLPDLDKKDDLGMPSSSPDHPAFAAPQLEEVTPEPFKPAAAPHPVQQTSGKDLEIISLKLDSLKNTLEAINARLARLEKMAEGGGQEFQHERRF